MIYTKNDRDRFLEFPYYADCVEDYIEELVEIWHTLPEDVLLSDFLGLKEEDYANWSAFGRVPDNITLMWVMGDY